MGLFYYIVLQCTVFYDINLTILPLNRPITAEFTEGFSTKMSLTFQHPLFVNNSNNNLIILQITQPMRPDMVSSLISKSNPME